MGAGINRLVLSLGFLSLFHAAFSAAQHRSYLRITSQEFTTLPLDIVVQGVASMFLVMWCVVGSGAGGGGGGGGGGLQVVVAAEEARAHTWPQLLRAHTAHYAHYNTRARALATR